MAKQKTWPKVLLGLVAVVVVGAIAVYATNPDMFQGSLRKVSRVKTSNVSLDLNEARTVEDLRPAISENIDEPPQLLCQQGTTVYEPGNANAMYQSMSEFVQAVKDGTLPDCNYHIQAGVLGDENMLGKCTTGFMAGFDTQGYTVSCMKHVGDNYYRMDLSDDHVLVNFHMDTMDSDGFKMSTYKRYDDVMVMID